MLSERNGSENKSNRQTTKRRTFLFAVSSSAVALAGCSDGGSGDGEEETTGGDTGEDGSTDGTSEDDDEDSGDEMTDDEGSDDEMADDEGSGDEGADDGDTASDSSDDGTDDRSSDTTEDGSEEEGDEDPFPQYEVLEDPSEREDDLPLLNAYIGYQDEMGEVAVNDAENLTVVGWDSQINEGDARSLADAEDSFTVQVTVRNDGDEEIGVGGISADYEVDIYPYVGDEQIDPNISDGSSAGNLVPGQYGNVSTTEHPNTEPSEFDRYEIHITG